MDKDKFNNQKYGVDPATKLKKPSKRSQLPSPKILRTKSKNSSLDSELHSSNDERNGPCLARKGTDAHQLPKNDGVCNGSIGSRVCVGGEKVGTLLYYGRTKFAKGTWCGIKLDEPVGKNNGVVDGHRYFTCQPGHGIFAPIEKVTIVNEVAANSTLTSKDNLLESSKSCIVNQNKCVSNSKLTSSSKCERFSINSVSSNDGMEEFNPLEVTKTNIFDVSYMINQNSSVNDFFEPNVESTPNNPLMQLTKFRDMPAYLRVEVDENLDDNGDVISNNELSEAANVQSGFGQQGSVDHDESLGILTPDQMKDFTLPLDSSCCGLVQTPSDEGIQEIAEEEVVDMVESPSLKTPVETVQGNKWETPEWVAEYHVWNVGIEDMVTPKYNGDLNLFDSTRSSSEKTVTDEGNIEMLSLTKPDVLNAIIIESQQRTVEILEVNCDKPRVTHLLTTDEEEKIASEMIPENVTVEKVIQTEIEWSELNESLKNDFVKPAIMDDVACEMILMESDAIIRHELLEVSVSKKESIKPAEMIVSATSIDTGYQGDVEYDMQSDAGTNPISTPVDEKHLVDSLQISLEQRLTGRIDAGSDSDFCSDMGASWTESEMDIDDKGGQRGGCRNARIIDGRLYYGGINAPRDVRSPAAAKEHACETDIRIASFPNPETTTNINEPTNISVTDTIAEKRQSDVVETVFHEELTCHSTENGTTHLDGCNKNVEESVSPVPSFASNLIQESSSDTLDTTITVMVSDITPLNDESASALPTLNYYETPVAKNQDACKSKVKSTTNKKPNKEVEKNTKTPKKNVMSKIKAMVEATSSKIMNKDASKNGCPVIGTTSPRGKENKKTPLKNKWHPVMSKIAANRIEEEKNPKIKREVVSKVNTNLVNGKVNGVARSPRPDIKSIALNKGVNQKPSVPLGGKATLTIKTNHKQLTSQKCRENKVKTVTDGSTSEVISQRSVSLKSKLPVSERPSTLQIRKLSSASRSASELSVATNDSQGTTMSQLTLASHSSSKPPLHDVSNVSIGSNRYLGLNQSKTLHAKNLINKNATNAELKSSSRSSKRPHIDPATYSQKKSILRVDKKTTVDPGEISGSRSKSNQTASNGFVKSGNQPDLLPASVGRSFQNQEVSRLESLCELRTKELNVVQLQLKHCALGFDSMAVIINYLANELNSFSAPAFRDELKTLQEKYRLTNLQLQEYKQANNNLSRELSILQDKFMVEQSEMHKRFRHKLETQKNEILKEYEKTIAKFLADKEEEKNNMKLEFHQQLERVNTEFKIQKQEINSMHNDLIEVMKAEHLKELENVKQSYETKIEEFRKIAEDFEALKMDHSNLEAKNVELENLINSDADVKVMAIANQKNVLKKEVESLQTVLDMKLSEIKKLQQDKMKLDDITDKLDKANDNIKKLRAKNEDLNEMVQSKTETERNLFCNNEMLQKQYASKSEDNKRLSLENEALQWKLRQSFSSSIPDSEGHSLNPTNYYYFWDDEGTAMSFNKGLMSSSWSGHSSSKNGSPCSPRDRFTWSPVNNFCTKMKQTPHNSFPHYHRSCSKVEDEQEIAKSPVTLRINSAKGKRRNITSMDSLNTKCVSELPKDNLESDDVANLGNKFSTNLEEKLRDCESPSLVVTNGVFNTNIGGSNLSTIYSDSENFVSDGSFWVNSDHKFEENCCHVEKRIDGFVENENNCTVETENEICIVEEQELCKLEENDCHVEEEESRIINEEIKAESWKIFDEGENIAECTRSTPDDVILDEEMVLPDLEDLFVISNDGISHIVSSREDNDDSFKRALMIPDQFSVNIPDEINFISSLTDQESNFNLLQEQFEDLVLEPILISRENEVLIDVNETSISSEEMLGSFEDSSSLITATETSSKEPFSTNEDINLNNIGNADNSSCLSDAAVASVPKTTTTVVITFRPNPTGNSTSSSRDSSPGQLVMENNAISEDANEVPFADDPSSSSRASPLGLDESFSIDKKTMHSLTKNMYRGTQSPRTSAGEALMAETEGSQMNIYESHRHQLLKKALQDQLPQSESSCSSNRELSSEDCSPLIGMSKPDTPDLFVHSLAADKSNVNGGGVNTDDSWSYSDDDLPSETEI